MIHPFLEHTNRPLVFAHRGGGGLAPENTMVAFDQAIAMNVDVLETDIHATRDGVLMAVHDPDLGRVTSGRGAIKAMTFAELQQIDAGYHWTVDGGRTFPFRGKGLKIPSLASLFERFESIRFNVDVKQSSPSIVAPFAAMVKRFNLAERLMVGSFDTPTVHAFRDACPKAAKSATVVEVRRFYVLNKLGLSGLYRTQADAFQIPVTRGEGGLRLVTERFARNLKKRGVQLHVWTVDEVAEMRQLIGWGVDGLITDYPDRMMKILGRANQNTPPSSNP
ncbi:MAG: glycerophosphodiester phosphodiesterase [Methylococcales bacterium]|nr:glycerophosphodiester phosphodiesterase [Methylococcales bacterium]